MRRHLVLAVVALATVSSAWAAERPFRTRAADATAWRLIDGALTRSETIRRLVQQLEESDLIVQVQVCYVAPPALGDTRITAVTEGARYLRVRVSAKAPLTDQMVVLGHELRHALEIADAPQVRDSEGQRELAQRIGLGSRAGLAYETAAAIAAGDEVRRELRGAKAR